MSSIFNIRLEDRFLLVRCDSNPLRNRLLLIMRNDGGVKPCERIFKTRFCLEIIIGDSERFDKLLALLAALCKVV